MNTSIIKFLDDKGYKYNEKAQKVIKACDAWYTNSATEFHSRMNVNGITRTIPSLNFAKRCCADDANLCEIVEINGGESSKQFDGINEILKRNRFDVMYRKQLEEMSASGTVGCYLKIENAVLRDETVISGKVAINYCEAENIVPLTVINDDVIECAFVGEDVIRSKKETVLVIFTLDEERRYIAETHYFDDEKELTDRATYVQLGEVRPFCLMRTAEVNNLKDMEGYGLPKILASIPFFEAIDLAYYILYGDLDKGEKLVFINELLSCITTGTDGKPQLSMQQKELFVLLGEKLPQQDNIIKEYNPELRVDEVTKIFELLLSMISLSFGYGTKKYTFEGGQIKSATEYIGERQDALQELNKQRKEATDYITNIVKAVIWFANTFEGQNWSEDEEVVIEFDDSYVTDEAVELERMRNDAMTFDIPKIKAWYLAKAYNLSDEEAMNLVMGEEERKDEEETDDANFGEGE